MSADNYQVGGEHYRKTSGEQHWTRQWRLHGPGYFVGCITKYVERYQDKDGIKDLKKAQHFLQKLIELEMEKATQTLHEKHPHLRSGTIVTKEMVEKKECIIHFEGPDGKAACGVKQPSNVAIDKRFINCPSCLNKLRKSDNDARIVCQERNANALRHEQSSDEIDVLPDECAS